MREKRFPCWPLLLVFSLVSSVWAGSPAPEKRNLQPEQSSPAKNKNVQQPQPAPSQAPPGFVEVQVLGVMDIQGSKAVILKDSARGILLPIYIGEAEAFSIQLRLDRRAFQRPLTHDLLDRLLRELGGELVKVQVDDLRNNTYLGTITFRQGKRVFSLDARPSDSIALAIGNQAPIFVARDVMEQAGIKPGDEEPEQQPLPEQTKEPPVPEDTTI